MLFNADNQTKQRIFNQYKQDAIDYHQRKKMKKEEEFKKKENLLKIIKN